MQEGTDQKESLWVAKTSGSEDDLSFPSNQNYPFKSNVGPKAEPLHRLCSIPGKSCYSGAMRGGNCQAKRA